MFDCVRSSNILRKDYGNHNIDESSRNDDLLILQKEEERLAFVPRPFIVVEQPTFTTAAMFEEKCSDWL
jgi:hypothetical protein